MDGLVLAVLVILVVAIVHHFLSKRGEAESQRSENGGREEADKAKEKEDDRDAVRLQEYQDILPMSDDQVLGETPSSSSRPRDAPLPHSHRSKQKPSPIAAPSPSVGPTVVVAYGTQSGTAKTLAHSLADDLQKFNYFNVKVKDLATYDADLLPYSNHYLFMVVSTYTEGRPTPSTEVFYNWVAEEGVNERSGNLLRTLKFGVFGLGNKVYGKTYYNRVSRTLDNCFFRMGAERIIGRGEGDESGDLYDSFDKWKANLIRLLLKRGDIPKGKSVQENGKVEEEEEDKESVADLEDLGAAPAVEAKEEDNDDDDNSDDDGEEANEFERANKAMISKGQRGVLTKQGYRVIGGHSAVKMCRWTKSMLRGRGGCYKHTFYGIASHQCMEATPSLACANKCVFCWRHHKNPVGREWRWKMDPPEMIIEEGLQNHIQMIKQMRGVPGVKDERYAEGFHVRHCALSLVGEPIIYPEINKFIDILHSKRISSFLVTNAQFPDQMSTLRPVTQMYISVDAANPDALKKVDRPLFEDFWDRYLRCIDVLRQNRQRSVFRMTLIKNFNAEDLPGYVTLIERGKPSFVEVKGVTFCGGTRPEIGMKDVPWHEEVVQFCKELESKLGGEYGIASEHEHSCCILLARKADFFLEGKWHTWIDFEKFQDLVAAGKPFTAADYVAPTPHWAVFGANERGFDPEESRMKSRQPYHGSGC